MGYLTLALVPLLSIHTGDADTAHAAILGHWTASDLENATIEVYEDNDRLICGKIIDFEKRMDQKGHLEKGEPYLLTKKFRPYTACPSRRSYL